MAATCRNAAIRATTAAQSAAVEMAIPVISESLSSVYSKGVYSNGVHSGHNWLYNNCVYSV